MWTFVALKLKQLLSDHWQGVRVSRGLLQALPSSQGGLMLALPLPTSCIRDAPGEQPTSDEQAGEKPLFIPDQLRSPSSKAAAAPQG